MGFMRALGCMVAISLALPTPKASARPLSVTQINEIVRFTRKVTAHKLRLGKNLLAEAQPETASSVLNSFQTTGKMEASRLYQLAKSAAMLEFYEAAIRHNEDALKVNPGHLLALFDNACYASLSKDANLAQAFLERLVIASETAGVRAAESIKIITKTAPELEYYRQANVAGLVSILEELNRLAPWGVGPKKKLPEVRPMREERWSRGGCAGCGMG